MNIRLECSTHGMKTSKHWTPTYNPWNFNFKPSDSHVQPMEWRPQTIQLPCPTNSHVQPMEWRPQTIQLPHTTHGTKTSNRHLIPMELPTLPNDDRCLVYPCTTSLFIHLLCWPCTMRIQYGRSYKCAPSPTLPNDDRHDDAKHDLLAIKVLTSSGVSAMKSDGEWINNAHYLSHI